MITLINAAAESHLHTGVQLLHHWKITFPASRGECAGIYAFLMQRGVEWNSEKGCLTYLESRGFQTTVVVPHLSPSPCTHAVYTRTLLSMKAVGRDCLCRCPYPREKYNFLCDMALYTN